MATHLIVNGVGKTTTSEALTGLFSSYGQVVSVALEKTKPSQITTVATVAMTNSSEALKAINSLRGKAFEGYRLSIKQAIPQASN